MKNLICPRCNTTVLNEKYEKDGLFVCANKLPDYGGCTCNKILGVYCSQCDELLTEDRFGLRGDVYECKQCGTPQWGYTEYKREHETISKEMNSYLQFMNDNLNMLKNKYNI